MIRGLVRKNNLSDLLDPIQARVNLGLATADYNRVRGLFQAGVISNVDLWRIAGSAGNYQLQIDSIHATLSGIDPSPYANRAGDTISGTWNNAGGISAVAVRVSGATPQASSDALFVHDYQGGQFKLTTSSIVASSGLTVERLTNGGGIVFASGVVPTKKVPVKIGGVSYFVEAG
jgi:hypothetical protein